MARIMKDSGVEWLGQIPETWKMVRTKNVFSNHKNIVGDKEAEYERLSLTLNGVLKRPKDDSKGLQSESLSTYQVLNEKELVFKMIDLENVNTSRVGYSSYTGIVSPVYIILNNEKYTRYGYYYFYNMWQRAIFNQLGNNGVRSALNASDMLNLPFPQLSQEEAEKIADFLDDKIGEVNVIISKTKTSIEEYKKYRQTIITEAVTIGIDGDVEVVNSNVVGLDKVRKDAEVLKFKYVGIVRANLVNVDDYLDFPQVSPDKIEKGSGKLLFCNKVKEAGVISDNHLFYKGMIVYSKIRPLLNKAIIAEFDGLCSADMYPIESLINRRYLLYYILSNAFLGQISVSDNRVKMPKLNKEELSEIKVVVPNDNEQGIIVEYLDMKCAEIDALIAKKEAFVEEMETYKKSLIYEYVTGKKEVI